MDKKIIDILKKSNTVAIVGLSKSPEKDSHSIGKYLKGKGYKIVPVNPTAEEILGEKCYPDLKSIPFDIDIVNVFRPSEDVPPIIEQAIETEAEVVWLQAGITADEKTEERVKNAGKAMIQDRCIAVTHSTYLSS